MYIEREFYLRVVKTMSKITFSPREDKFPIFKPLCNFLYII